MLPREPDPVIKMTQFVKVKCGFNGRPTFLIVFTQMTSKNNIRFLSFDTYHDHNVKHRSIKYQKGGHKDGLQNSGV